MQETVEKQIQAAQQLCSSLRSLSFSGVTVYNPLDYAFAPFQEYTQRYGEGPKRVLFLGMNPGPWGMAQTGVPFGEVRIVKEWLKLSAPIYPPLNEHPKRRVLGYACTRSEVSGARLWGLFKEQFGTPEKFFQAHFVVNYCPLLFIADTPTGARNVTPDKLSKEERIPLYDACNHHLQSLILALSPTHLVGVGKFAVDKANHVLASLPDQTRPIVTGILHPSPASPRSNGGQWTTIATEQLRSSGVW